MKNATLQVRLTEDKSAVEMSKILMWYRKDFGNDDAAVITTVAGQVFDFDFNWLLIILNLQKQNKYVKVSLLVWCRHLADKSVAEYMKANAAKLKLQYKDYDWSTFAVNAKWVEV